MQADSPFFLNVEKSITGRAWRDRLTFEQRRIAGAISSQWGHSDVLSRILAARGVFPENTAQYLDPKLRDLLPNPSDLQQMDRFASLLAESIEKSETIALFGDYDVDGASSCALMVHYLRHFGLEPLAHIPDRIFEGYGPNMGAIDALHAQGATTLMTLDCGTTSHESLAHAKSLGMQVLVLDHHQVEAELPEVDALVNPNRPDDVSGLGDLCAGGVTFMAMVATNRELRSRGTSNLPDLMAMIDLVALATVCDVVPLVGLNRAFVQRGLEIVRAGGNQGIRALSLAARMSGPANTYSLGYLIGPRINAGGRIGDASLGLKLLTSNDESETMALAAKLDELNSERQAIEAAAVEEAIAVADKEIGEGAGPSVIVLASEQWHPGVVGLIAARLKERFNRPAFAIALRRDGTGTGSGRSVLGVDLGKAVHAAREAGVITKGGGHAMAAGVSIAQEKVGAFKALLGELLESQVLKATQNPNLEIEAAITARAASVSFINDTQTAGPFGAGNQAPLFAFPSHRIKFADIVGAGGHVRCTIGSQDGAKLSAIAFRAANTELGQKLLTATDMDSLHICGALNVNHWQGRETAQLRIEDLAVQTL